ncbi:TROVE domain-containing protein [Acetivibrio clariflavus]|uniref:TROVE domain-containing protein n=1 Tax=Acetivibrio clariflavus (strain DSM 19732 / NBRC 101661 / EBR45) TaxID=720554 RepID=G8LV85_ACECE|nr:TROVE domain-containing protein [Acetivibrio clariflavus]AEV67439.1 TROVE domain-containing protein [Acetivibrio clariflavus DSM 19732]
MSKFNLGFSRAIKTINNEGATAYPMNDKEKLVTQVLTSFFNENKFYGDNSQDILNTVRNVIKTEAKFVANLCIYARNEMHLRTISHVLVSELAKSTEGKEYVRKTLNKIIERPDDMTEVLAYYLNTYGKPIPNSVKKGLADSFGKFDEYQLAKYNRKNAIKLKDILCLAHPKAKDERQSDLWKRLLEDRLETHVTWETELSTKGNTKETWERLIEENRLGYMAMLRNLRNIIKSGASNLNKVYEYLTDEERVLKNKQLPFRYYSAYKTLKNEGIGTSKIYDALETAIKISTKNIDRLTGKTLIAADVSGSMNFPISRKSDLTCAEVAVLMLSIANYICEETITKTFDNYLYTCNLATQNGIIANANSIKVNGGGTDITLPLRYLLDRKIFVDRIIILSDNEINREYSYNTGYNRSSTCQALVEEYKKRINPDVWVHAIDMQGYGTQQFKGKNVNIIAGWSERVFDFISSVEQGMDSLIDKISSYYFK